MIFAELYPQGAADRPRRGSSGPSLPAAVVARAFHCSRWITSRIEPSMSVSSWVR